MNYSSDIGALLSSRQKQRIDDCFEYGLTSSGYASDLVHRLEETNKQIEKLPNLNAQDGKGDNAIIHARLYYKNCEWFITEWDREDTLFGYVILNGDIDMSELGYVSLKELKDSVPHLKLDLVWEPMTIGEMKKSRGIYG